MTPFFPEGPIVQIAGIASQSEADLVIASGADWLAFPLRLPVNREDLSEAAARRILASLPDATRGILITYLNKADDILAFCRFMGCTAIQLHGAISNDELRGLRHLSPGLFILKSLVIRTDNTPGLEEEIRQKSSWVDGFITDTHDPDSGADGATGKIHDWRISRKLVEISPKPVILAGGLNPENVRAAIEVVKPAGVDVHTGVENALGEKCPEKCATFVANARKAFRQTADSVS